MPHFYLWGVSISSQLQILPKVKQSLKYMLIIDNVDNAIWDGRFGGRLDWILLIVNNFRAIIKEIWCKSWIINQTKINNVGS